MSVLHDLLAELETLDHETRAELANKLAGAAPQEPARPATVIDHLRELGADAVALATDEVPSLHEVPIIVGILAKHVQAIWQAIEPQPAPPAPQPAPPAPEPAPTAPPFPAGGGSVQP